MVKKPGEQMIGKPVELVAIHIRASTKWTPTNACWATP